jgi:hypothetical protein
VLKRIRIIVAVITENSLGRTEQSYLAAARPDGEITVVHLDRDPASFESDYEDALAVPDLVNIVQAASRE